MKPMLAHVFSPSRMTPPFVVQPKLNGVRCLYQNQRCASRDEILWNPGVLAHIVNELDSLHLPPEWILDGELYLHGRPLQKINSAVAVKRLEPSLETQQIQYHVFDTVSSSGFLTRFRTICPFLKDLKHVKLVPTHLCNSLIEADQLFFHYRQHDYEGIMYRDINSPYRPNARVHTLLKRKGWIDGEFPIVGIEEGEGRCAGMLGSLTCITPNGVKFSVGTGFDDLTRRKFYDSPPIGLYAKVQYLCLSVDGSPLNTSFLCLM